MEYIRIGKIINTHGIKGEVVVEPLTNNVDRFDDLETVYLGNDKTSLKIEQTRVHKNRILLKFKKFNNINEVLLFKGISVYIDEVEKKPLGENQFFIYDIIGCLVFDKEGKKVGVVTEINQSAVNDIYTIKNKEKNEEYLIPAIKEFFLDVDIKNKRIVIDPIKGMIE